MAMVVDIFPHYVTKKTLSLLEASPDSMVRAGGLGRAVRIPKSVWG